MQSCSSYVAIAISAAAQAMSFWGYTNSHIHDHQNGSNIHTVIAFHSGPKEVWFPFKIFFEKLDKHLYYNLPHLIYHTMHINTDETVWSICQCQYNMITSVVCPFLRDFDKAPDSQNLKFIVSNLSQAELKKILGTDVWLEIFDYHLIAKPQMNQICNLFLNQILCFTLQSINFKTNSTIFCFCFCFPTDP